MAGGRQAPAGEMTRLFPPRGTRRGAGARPPACPGHSVAVSRGSFITRVSLFTFASLDSWLASEERYRHLLVGNPSSADWLRARPSHPLLPMHFAYFHAPWCGVCHEKAPVVEEIASAAKLELQRWDIEEEAGRSEAERRRIKTVPTLALIHGERVPFRLVGRMITPENVRYLLAKFSPAGS